MSLAEQQAQLRIKEIVSRLNVQLLDRLNSFGKDKAMLQKQLPADDASLLSSLPRNSIVYQIFSSLLSADTLFNELVFESERSERVVFGCYENMSHLLENFTLMEKVLEENDRNLLRKAFRYSYEHLSFLITNLHQYPVSTRNSLKKDTFIQRHISILQEAKDQRLNSSQQNSAFNIEEQSSSQNQEYYRQLQIENEQLMDSNEQLKQSLVKAEKQLAQLELKLMQILNQREEECENMHHGAGMMQNGVYQDEDLRDELVKARMELDRMNEQFKIEINKYNQVFRSMEAEIEDLRAYSSRCDRSVGHTELVQELETEIVRLREERERDELIILELRDRERQLYREICTVRQQNNNGGGGWGMGSSSNQVIRGSKYKGFQ